jgi:hypothetical protein
VSQEFVEDVMSRALYLDRVALKRVAALESPGWTAGKLRSARAELYEMGTIYVCGGNLKPLISHLQSLGNEVATRMVGNGIVAVGLAQNRRCLPFPSVASAPPMLRVTAGSTRLARRAGR